MRDDMSKNIKSYPKVLQIHQLETMGGVKLSEDEWFIEEKIDGSLFRCSVVDGKYKSFLVYCAGCGHLPEYCTCSDTDEVKEMKHRVETLQTKTTREKK
jgi:ATP-dependent RNA circularization protein (DNA/RNA ligase family)